MGLLKLFLVLHEFLTPKFGGGSSGGSSPYHPYSPTGLGAADTNWQTLMNDWMVNNVGMGTPEQISGSELTPTFNYIQDLIGSPTGAGTQMLSDSQLAGNYYMGMASQADAFHNILSNEANTSYGNQAALTSAGNEIWNTALDPQNALFNQTQQQVQDSSRSAASSAGLGTSPEGVGTEDQAMNNFLIDWQNQQLQRQQTGLAAMGTAYGQGGQQGVMGGQDISASQAMSAFAPQDIMQAGQLPFNTAMSLGQDAYSNSTGYMSAAQATEAPWYQMMSQMIPYMNYGTGAQGNAFGAGQSNLQNLFSLGQNLVPGVSNALSGIFNNPFTSAVSAVSGGNPNIPLTGAEIGAGDFAAGGIDASDLAGLVGGGADFTIADLLPLLIG